MMKHQHAASPLLLSLLYLFNLFHRHNSYYRKENKLTYKTKERKKETSLRQTDGNFLPSFSMIHAHNQLSSDSKGFTTNLLITNRQPLIPNANSQSPRASLSDKMTKKFARKTPSCLFCLYNFFLYFYIDENETFLGS